MLLYFPSMHPDLLDHDPVPCALFLDPGFETQCDGARYFRPPDLPLDPQTARALVRDSLRFGEQFMSPGDMTAVSLAAEADRRKEESTASIRGELLRRIRGEQEADASEAARRLAQYVLLLAWSHEERVLEMIGRGKGLEEGGARFGQALGVGDEDGQDLHELRIDQAVSGVAAPIKVRPDYDWPQLLEAVSWFLPADAVLLAGGDVAAGLAEGGAPLVPCRWDFLPDRLKGCLGLEAPVRLLVRRGPTPPVSVCPDRPVRLVIPGTCGARP